MLTVSYTESSVWAVHPKPTTSTLQSQSPFGPIQYPFRVFFQASPDHGGYIPYFRMTGDIGCVN